MTPEEEARERRLAQFATLRRDEAIRFHTKMLAERESSYAHVYAMALSTAAMKGLNMGDARDSAEKCLRHFMGLMAELQGNETNE